jgi:tetratricopeptide (TPR) repeat protein
MLAMPAVAAILAIGILTFRQVSYWHDSETLWTHALQVTRRNYIAEDSLGGALAGQGRVEEAIQHFRAAAAINPRDPFSHLNTGTYELQHGNLQAAIEHYQAVVQYTSSPALLTSAHAYLGTAYRKLGDAAHARENYDAALQLQPANAVALTGLGLLSWKAGDFAAAAQQFSTVAAVRPTDVAFLLLAKAEAQRGHTAEAQAAYEQAQKLSADFTQAQQDVADLLAQ